jgi:hypothetical protein
VDVTRSPPLVAERASSRATPFPSCSLRSRRPAAALPSTRPESACNAPVACTVTLASSGEGTEAEVTYDLTALTDQADDELREFAEDYPAYLRSWQDAISQLLPQ